MATIDSTISQVAHEELLSGLIQLHVLHHAAEEEIYGLEMLTELRRHGYRISPGTLYPMLHRLAQRGYLVGRQTTVGRTRRRLYRATPKGRKALEHVRHHIRELFGELVEEAAHKDGPGKSRAVIRR